MYGGTKTEMERLLKDAEEWTKQKYDIDNLADVYNAIHAIQDKLGIVGATAAEAEKTITGSANMTKAAWKNVLKALGGGGDLEMAINNLVFSITKLFQNVMPVVERAISGIGQLIEQAAPALVETVAAALIKAIPRLLDAIYYMIIGLAKGIYNGIVSLFKGTTKEIEKQLTATNGIADNNSKAADSAEKLADETEKAGKAAKKALAGFDELNILTSGTAEEETQESSGKSSASSVVSALRAETEQAASPLLKFVNLLGNQIAKLFEPLKKININPAINALKKIGIEAGKIFEQIWNVVSWIWAEALAPIAQFWTEEIAPRSLESLRGIFSVLREVITPVVNSLDDFKVAIEPITEWIGDALVECLDKINERFDSLAKLFAEKTPEMERLMKNLGVIVSKLWEVVGPVLTMLKDQFMVVFDFIADLLETTIGEAIDALTGFTDFIAGVLTGDWKAAFNGLIDVLNSAVSFVIGGVNDMIKALNGVSKVYPDWWPNKDKMRLNIPTIPIPQIPHLAQGAVIPPGAPFYAVLGDQKNGRNLEAPEGLIRDIIKDEMSDVFGGMMAGFEAVVEEVRNLRDTVDGIEVGDTTIGQAAARYNRKMSIITGGT